jgi:oxygen-independent coproporphyrinogen-3 oxidase|tara:strand:- start:29589 stop:30716 length:1128 start_codon:yes stop_codon:yes gene_type:complete
LAGIYIHIPFCKQKCNYCNFHFSTKKDNVEELVSGMIIELDQRKSYLKTKKIDSIYFGGGTPSIIDVKHIISIIEKIYSLYEVKKSAEITMEFNPDDIKKEKLNILRTAGINRLSIGIQSFENKDLIFMNRSHNAAEAINSIQLAKECGFDNISIDLIYGVPNQTESIWKKNLQQMFDLQIDHFSAYALTVEPNTKLNYLIKKKKIKPLSESKSENHFKILQEISSEMGYKQYEISNFCRKDKFALHNTSYWEDKIYLGIGPSAHSYNGESRRWNISNNLKYITFINSGEKYFDEEILSINQKYNEYTLTSLRTIWGVSLDYLENNFDKMITSHFKKNSRKWIENENAILENNSLKLTNKGMLFADAISSDLFII